ncbi:MAG: hypothetical protein WBA89_01570 [Microcoleus sp.]|uniref:hypothetical protein n=1 Tax=Microcoleus sp. TaxID=44472 RepID=UPI003C7929AB
MNSINSARSTIINKVRSEDRSPHYELLLTKVLSAGNRFDNWQSNEDDIIQFSVTGLSPDARGLKPWR